LTEKGATVIGELSARGEAIAREMADVGQTVIQTIENRSANVASILETQGGGIAARIDGSADRLNSILAEGVERSTGNLNGLYEKLSVDVAGVLGRLHDANKVLNGILASATKNLESVENGLTDRVRTLESTMGSIIADTAATSGKVEQQVMTLREVSDGVLREAASLAEQIESRGSMLARAADDLSKAQSRIGVALDEKGTDVRGLIEAIERQSGALEATIGNFNQQLHEQLADAEARVRELSTALNQTSDSSTAAVRDQFDLIRSLAAKERERTSATLKAIYEQAMGEMSQVLSDTTDKYREQAESLRAATSAIAQELEETRVEISRGTIALPRDVRAQTGAVKRAVTDQLKALTELNALTERANFDVATAQPTAAKASVRSAPEPQPAPRAPQPAPRAPAQTRAKAEPPVRGTGWLSDLLTNASRETEVRQAEAPAASERGIEALDALSGGIARLV
ncbi:MAG: hypothetical protein ACRCTI_21995, partial [Beijerinckiaceae bacterium]